MSENIKNLDSKKHLYDLLSRGWDIAKFYFGKEFETPAEYNEFVQFANDKLKQVAIEYGTTGKDYKFACRFFSLVNQYCDTDWRQRNGVQMSLFTEDDNDR